VERLRGKAPTDTPISHGNIVTFWDYEKTMAGNGPEEFSFDAML
jgi:hypothetical protein